MSIKIISCLPLYCLMIISTNCMALTQLANNIFTYTSQPSMGNTTLPWQVFGGYRAYLTNQRQFGKDDSFSPFKRTDTADEFNYASGNPILNHDPSGHWSAIPQKYRRIFDQYPRQPEEADKEDDENVMQQTHDGLFPGLLRRFTSRLNAEGRRAKAILEPYRTLLESPGVSKRIKLRAMDALHVLGVNEAERQQSIFHPEMRMRILGAIDGIKAEPQDLVEDKTNAVELAELLARLDPTAQNHNRLIDIYKEAETNFFEF